MSVNEKLMAPGTFNVSLNLESTPNSVINSMIPWGNIVLTATRINPDEFTDAQIRDLARYVGIVMTQEIGEEGFEIAGKGILTYLGDTDSRGLVLARNAGVGSVRAYVNDTLDDVIDRSGSTPYGILRDEESNQKGVRKGNVTEVTYDDTVLLLNFEGSDGDTTTSDGSAYTSNQVISFSGTSDISSDQAKYGNTSLNLTTDGFVTVADRPELDLTYNEFTVEWWEYRTSQSGNPTVMARNDDTYSPWIFGKAVNGKNKAFITHDGDGYNEDEDLNIEMGTIDLNQWNHFAISHKGDHFRTFKNGVIQQTDKRPELFVRVSSDSLQIGKGQGGNYFEGYLDGMVITRGNAKYWDAFTPSTSAPSATTAAKTYTGDHYLESAYKALKTVSTYLGSEFRMNNNGTLDVGPASSIFTGHENNEPEAIIVRRLSGQDPEIKGYEGYDLTTEFNAEDYVSRIELIASNYGKEVNLGQADQKDIPYKDLFGNPLERIQLISENEIPESMRDIRAEAYLNEYNKIDRTLNVGLVDYDISGDINVGDIIYVYDPEVGFEDTQADATLENRDKFEIAYQGQILNPVKIRVMGLSFPITTGMGVYYRDKDGDYTDITDYVNFEVGSTQIEVGSTTPNINQDLRGSASVIGINSSNELTVPDAPTSLAAATGTYQDGSGRPFAFARLTWNEPTNTNGTRITDGNMYRVRYRQVTDVDGNNLIDSNDNQVTDYEYLTVEFGTTAVVIKGLGPSNTYEFGVACIDNSGYSGGFAVLTATQMPVDATVPPQPTPLSGTFGSLASNAARVQVSHKLGAAKDLDGNVISSPTNFTLPRDIDHLNVYRGLTSNFTISAAGLVGELQARASHIDHQIETVGSFPVDTSGAAFYRVTAVDVAGNESDPSDAVEVTEELIGTQYVENGFITNAKIGDAQITDAKVSDLSAGKITAGTISGEEIIIDTDSATDPSNPVLGTIRSSNYVANTSGWIIKSNGDVEFESGTFRGDLDGAGGTFSGTISANQVTGGTLDFNSVTAGNLDFSSLSVQAGDIVAEIATGEITDALIGDVSVGKLTSGSIVGNSITLGSSGNTSGSISSHNFSSGSAGFSIDYDGDAEFNNVTVRGDLDGVELTGILDFNGGTFRTSSSTPRIEITDNNQIEGEIRYESSNGTVMRLAAESTSPNDFFIENGLSSGLIKIQTGVTGTGLEINGNEVNFATPLGSNNPVIKLNGTNANSAGTSTLSKLLGVDSSGRLAVGSSTSGVSSISVTGELQLSGSGGVLNINHNDSDHDDQYYTKASVNTLLGGKSSTGHGHTESDISDIGSHGHSGFANSTHSHIANEVTGTISVTSVSSGGFVNSLSYNNSNKTLTVGGSNTRLASITTRGYGVQSSGQNVGNGGIGVTLFYTSLNAVSDETLKTGITDLTYGLDWINDLRPISYRYDTRTVYVCETEDCEFNGTEYLLSSDECDGCDNTPVSTEVSWGNTKENWGFSAQEIEATLPTDPDLEIVEDTEFVDGSTKKVLDYNQVIAPLVKAVQELSAKNDELESRIAALEG